MNIKTDEVRKIIRETIESICPKIIETQYKIGYKGALLNLENLVKMKLIAYEGTKLMEMHNDRQRTN